MEDVRLRLVFADRYMLSRSQRTEGLKRSWFLLKPHHHTISDLANYLLHIYNLFDACPNGLLLSMDGFVLPPFESTSIFKDNDIIRVKKKQGTSLDTTEEIRDGVNNLELEVVEKQPINAGMKLLADEKFEKEMKGYQSESEDDDLEQLEDKLLKYDSPDKSTVSKKRKASKKLQTPKKKRNKHATTEERSGALRDDQNNVLAEKNHCFQQPDVLVRNCSIKKKSSYGQQEADTDESSSGDSDDARSNDIYTPCPKRSSQMQENGEKSVVPSDVPDENKKCSRSSRRKKAKRQWLKELAKVEKKEKLVKTDSQNGKCAKEHQQEDNNEEDNIVPVVVRPGHIRFEPIGDGDTDQAIQYHEVPETFQWNGITCKKKGQKWGKEKPTSWRKRDDKNLNQESFERCPAEEETPLNLSIDFNKLKPYTTLPEEGDIVAYRLIELSSSWTPELSTFRVGKVKRRDTVSDKVVLVPVSEHPIVSAIGEDEESAAEPIMSLYAEDGSLEIDYSSLVDVRLIKLGNLNKPKVANGGGSDIIRRDMNPALAVRPDNNVEAQPSRTENGKSNPWAEISQALSVKKAQLSQESQWSKGESSGTRSWSRRAMRGSALGPTMALLRSQNGFGEEST